MHTSLNRTHVFAASPKSHHIAALPPRRSRCTRHLVSWLPRYFDPLKSSWCQYIPSRQSISHQRSTRLYSRRIPPHNITPYASFLMRYARMVHAVMQQPSMQLPAFKYDQEDIPHSRFVLGRRDRMPRLREGLVDGLVTHPQNKRVSKSIENDPGVSGCYPESRNTRSSAT